MRRFIAAAALLIAPALSAHSQDITMDTNDDGDVTSCSQIHVSFDGERAATAEQELPAASLRSLKITSDQHGGIRVTGWDQPRYAVTVCKAAATPSVLSRIDARLSGDEASVNGPDSGRWVAFFLVRTPRNATLDVSVHNGPVGLHHVNGTLKVRAQNGPIALKDASGTIDATTVNGPISLAGGSGNVRITATNGPLSVKLSGTRWDGTLDATTENGPVSLKVPRNFGSGVELNVKGHGPISCKAEACRGAARALRDDDERDAPRQLTFGNGAKNVTLTTVNGPVSVKEID